MPFGSSWLQGMSAYLQCEHGAMDAWEKARYYAELNDAAQKKLDEMLEDLEKQKVHKTNAQLEEEKKIYQMLGAMHTMLQKLNNTRKAGRVEKGSKEALKGEPSADSGMEETAEMDVVSLQPSSQPLATCVAARSLGYGCNDCQGTGYDSDSSHSQ